MKKIFWKYGDILKLRCGHGTCSIKPNGTTCFEESKEDRSGHECIVVALSSSEDSITSNDSSFSKTLCVIDSMHVGYFITTNSIVESIRKGIIRVLE